MQTGGTGARMHVPLPEGVTEEMRAEIRRKRQAGEALTPAESTASVRMREAFQRMREQQGGGMPGAQGAAAPGAPAGQGGAPGQAPGVTGSAPAAGAPAAGGGAGEASAMRLPPGVTEAQARDILRRRFSGGTLTPQEQAIATRVMQGFQQQPAGSGGAQRRRFGSGSSFQFGGSYIVFVLENGRPTPKRIRTGYTDMDYSEVVSGLTEQDTVLLLPSASLVNQQAQMRNRMSQMGGGVPGMTKAPTGGPGGGGPPPGGGRPGGDH